MDVVLCALSELADPGCREFSWGEESWPLALFMVRRGGEVFGFVNRCPHAGHPLNWQPDRFLTVEEDLILCSSHGARFNISDGVCVAGPCPGASLERVALTVRDGDVVADADELSGLAGRLQKTDSPPAD